MSLLYKMMNPIKYDPVEDDASETAGEKSSFIPHHVSRRVKRSALWTVLPWTISFIFAVLYGITFLNGRTRRTFETGFTTEFGMFKVTSSRVTGDDSSTRL